MHEIIEEFVSHLKSKGFEISENANPNTGKGSIQWLHPVKKIGGTLPVSFFEKYIDTYQDDDEEKVEIDLDEITNTFTQEY